MKQITLPPMTAAAREGGEGDDNAFRAAGNKTLTLAGALRKFIETDTRARNAQISSVSAGETSISLVKEFNAFLVRHDFDANVMVGCGYVKRLVSPCPQIAEDIKEHGEPHVTYNMQHAVVRVSGVVLDICFLRMGSTYMQMNNYPWKEFIKFWREIKDVKHLMSITPEKVKNMMKIAKFDAPHNPWQDKKDKEALKARWDSQSAAVFPSTWFVYTKSVATILKVGTKKYRIAKGDYFSVRECNTRSDIITLASLPDETIKLSIPKSEELMEKAREVKAPPTNALKPPKQIKLSMIPTIKTRLQKPDTRSTDDDADDEAQPVTPMHGRIPVIELEYDDGHGLDLPAMRGYQ